jgi:phosphoenolpyruvate carboxylase
MTMIPRCMSTQHPDNASVPFFASSAVLAGEDEIREAYYAFSHLGCDEQMWDVEGKEIDTYVVKKLLTYYPEYFREHVLGEDLRITLRVPNPTVEAAEAKILLETLESIPRSYDAARLFYERDVAPIFEVILPMTTSSRCIDRIYRYYADHIIGRQRVRLRDDDITIAEWIGEFSPSRIQVIPLFEDVPTMLKADNIVEEYLSDKEVEDQRVFLARSDTAMNFGLVSAALANVQPGRLSPIRPNDVWLPLTRTDISRPVARPQGSRSPTPQPSFVLRPTSSPFLPVLSSLLYLLCLLMMCHSRWHPKNNAENPGSYPHSSHLRVYATGLRGLVVP